MGLSLSESMTEGRGGRGHEMPEERLPKDGTSDREAPFEQNLNFVSAGRRGEENPTLLERPEAPDSLGGESSILPVRNEIERERSNVMRYFLSYRYLAAPTR